MENNKKVSIIIPTYNRRGTISRAIDSVLRQTYKNYEIIIVDDCSTDDTLSLVSEKYGGLDNLIYIINDANLGPAGSRNVGADSASGDYIAFMDSDDEWVIDALERLVNRLSSTSGEYGMAYGILELHRADGSVFCLPNIQRGLLDGDLYASLLINPFISVITMCIRTEVFREFGGFTTELQALEDYDLSIKIAQKYLIAFVPGVLAISHESTGSVSSRVNEKKDALLHMMKTYDADYRRYNLTEYKFHVVLNEMIGYGIHLAFLRELFSLDWADHYKKYIVDITKEWSLRTEAELIKTKNISGVQNCIGCNNCLQTCEFNAITMSEDPNGFIRPTVDENKCINCEKCIKKCPSCNTILAVETPKACLAAMAPNDIRIDSSSGGIFPLLAKWFVEEQKGYVCGAVYENNYRVRHIVANETEDILKMKGSKYIQSYLSNCFEQISELLAEGKKVMFTGTPCQNAALIQYLPDENKKNLYCIDVVCHGVSSYAYLKKFVDEMGLDINELDELSFRKKEKCGWTTHTYFRSGDEEKIFNDQDFFINSYLNNWILRDECYECKYKKGKFSDISLGDFWGISDLNDGLGTSYVSVNTEKGFEIWEATAKGVKAAKVKDTAEAVAGNICITTAVNKTKAVDYFQNNFRKGGNIKLAYENTLEYLKYDVALVVMWSQNYGNAFTNYALYTYLKRLGKRVLMLDNYCPLVPRDQFKSFAEKYYELSSHYFQDYNYPLLIQCCSNYMVGSDQVWNMLYEQFYHYGLYFQLASIPSACKKMSYASSFGERAGALDEELGKEYYAQFSSISVREDEAVDILMSNYGVKAEKVLDPVFLLSSDDYRAIADAGKVINEPYMAIYILNPTYKKVELCKRIAKEKGIGKLCFIIDANPNNKIDSKLIIGFEEDIYEDLSPNKWIGLMMNADFIITDSYHGACFSMIFEKQFLAIKNRENSRFDSFNIYDTANKHIFEQSELDNIKLEDIGKIDYNVIRTIINREKEKSSLWLNDAMANI